MIEIEKNVPLPACARPRNRYPFKQMEVGDSFVVGKDSHNSVRSAAHIAGRAHGMTFTSHRDGETVRVWRIA